MTSDDSLRTFIAAPLASPVHDFLLHHQHLIAERPWAKRVRWIAQENVHLTLRFLGTTSPQQVEILHRYLQDTLTKLSAFDIDLLQPVPFPTIKRPRVVAAPVKRNRALEQLVACIEAQVTRVRFAPEDRPYRGHVTIGRVKRSIPGKDLLTESPESIQTQIKSVVFFKSELTPTGAVYVKLHEYPLRAAAKVTA